VRHPSVFVIFCAAPLLASALGCGAAKVDPQLTEHRQRLILAEEPSGAMGVLDARESAALEADITLVGQIGGSTSPWSPGQASFVMIDPAAAAEGHEHCGEDCPFCKHKSDGQDALALVQFQDEQGSVLPIDARELFQLHDQDTVVVRGRAHINEFGLLVVAASGIYLRR
jgi:hypothetical protein